MAQFEITFGKVAGGRIGKIQTGNMKHAATVAAEIAFALGAHAEYNHVEWFMLNRGRPRASWECPTGAWVTVTRIEQTKTEA